MGCVAPAVPSKLSWIPRHCWKNGVKPPLFLLFLVWETAKVYRIESIKSGQTELPLYKIDYKNRMFVALILKNKQYVALDAKKVAHP